MGWFGHGIYDGDDTHTRHIDFLKWAKICKNANEALNYISRDGTILDQNQQKILRKNTNLILNRMPATIINEDHAIEWQMLLSLFVDNNMKPLKRILKMGIEATEFLIEECSDDFNEPKLRRSHLKNFIKSAKKTYGN